MLMGQSGIPAQEEKEYTFITPLEHGLSYKRVNPEHTKFKFNLAHCWNFLEESIEKGNTDLIQVEDLVSRIKYGHSDLWVSSIESRKIVGCFVIGAAPYPQMIGVEAEAIAGKFNFKTMLPELEKYYKARGYKFVEMTGRKGWERVMKPLGYEFSNITIYKRL